MIGITLSFNLSAQISIGAATPHASAVLDINVNSLPNNAKKGLLLPRVDLTDALDVVTIPAPATGLLVYNRTDAGTEPDDVVSNNIYVWQADTWKKFSNIPEVKELKVPIDFAIASATKQIFTSPEITAINSPTTVEVVPVKWNLATDVIILNPDDIYLENTTQVRVLTSSLYQISGTFSFNPDTSGSATNTVLTLQKSTNNGATWTNVIGAALPFETGIAQHVQSIVFPDSVKRFEANDLLRFVVSRPKNPHISGPAPANYGTNSGVQSRLDTDLNKSVRFTRLTE